MTLGDSLFNLLRVPSHLDAHHLLISVWGEKGLHEM